MNIQYAELKFIVNMFLIFRRVEWIKSLHDYKHSSTASSGFAKIWRVKRGL